MGSDKGTVLPGRAGCVDVIARNNQLFVESVLYRYCAGIPGRDLLEHYGDFRAVHLLHSRWSNVGAWKRIIDTLAQNADNGYTMIDSTIVTPDPENLVIQK